MSNANDKYCVYAHINKINGKIYIGQTCYGDNPNLRWLNGLGYRNSTYFNKAIQKYGWDSFEHRVCLSNLSLEDANYFEELLIKKLDTTNRNKGYNLRDGGNNSKLSEEIKQKISQTLKGKYCGENSGMYGKHHTEETKAKIRQNHADLSGTNNPNYGKHFSEEHRNKISKALKGANSPNYGKQFSEETRNKMSESHKGKQLSKETKEKIGRANKNPSAETRKKLSESRQGIKHPNTKRVSQYDKQKNFIRTWDYIKQASETLNINATHICLCCKGKYKTAGGFIWEYAD